MASPRGLTDRAEFAELAGRFAGVRVVALGDVMLDRYVSGGAERMSPEAPVPVVRVEREWAAPGGAANVAANVLALGARCDLVGVAGDDEAGRALRSAVAALGGRARLVRDGSRATTVKTRVLARGQQVARLDREDSSSVARPARIALGASLAEVLPGAGALVLADYDKGALSPALIRRAIGMAREHGVPVIADPKRRHFFDFAGAAVLKPNRAEIEAALGEEARPDDAAWMEAARERTGAEHLLLTLGADGMALSSRGGGLHRARARARAVYDVAGAGDTVAAAVAVVLAAGGSLRDAVEIATAAAAAGVARVGVATVTVDEVAAQLQGRNPPPPDEGGAPAALDKRAALTRR